MPDFTNIFKDGLLVDVDVSFWSGSKVLKAEDLGLKEEDVAEAYKLGKKLLVPAEVIREFRSIESKARRVVEINSFPFPIGNARFIPRRKFDSVLGELQKCQSKYLVLVDKLIENYDQYRQQMLPVYQQAAENAFINQTPETPGPEKNKYIENFLKRIESYYPPSESLRRKFSLSWDVYEVAIPRMKKNGDDPEKENVYLGKMQKKISGFVEEVVRILRTETVEVCAHVTQNLKDGKVVKGRTLKALSNFIERFEELNFVGDREIATRLESLRKDLLESYSHDTIVEDSNLQAELGRRLHELAETAADMTDINSVTGEYNRKVVWEEGA